MRVLKYCLTNLAFVAVSVDCNIFFRGNNVETIRFSLDPVAQYYTGINAYELEIQLTALKTGTAKLCAISKLIPFSGN